MRRELVQTVVAGGILSCDQARDAGRDLVTGKSEPLLVAAFLGALSARGETAGELAGLAEAFREVVTPFPSRPDALDTCGTGGDGRCSFNLSTAAALVVASLGVPVAKHGNRSVSSRCGSADLIEALGYPLDETPAEASARLAASGFAFLFAPRYHPAMAHVAPIRRALGVRTVFNLLGPLLNPAGVRRQVVGVFDPARIDLMIGSLQALGSERAIVLHGAGGFDEAVLHGPVEIAELSGGRITRAMLTPVDFHLPPGDVADLAGGDADANVALFADLLAGRGPKPLADAVAANAALALRVAGVEEDLAAGAAAARAALVGGRTAAFVATVLNFAADGEGRRRAHVS